MKDNEMLKDTIPPDAVFTPERFVEAFVAKLVEQGLRSMSPRERPTRRALSAVVELIDDLIHKMEAGNVPWEKLVPWVRMANSLRPSSLGGVENWEHHLRAAQGFLTRVPNPSYEVVEFAIGPEAARFELKQLESAQLKLVDQAFETFRDSRDSSAA